MKKFVNLTNSANEKSIKIGQNAPKDSAVLAWFNTNPISPQNNVTIFDLSETILENKIPSPRTSEIMLADEFGILRRLDGSSVVSSNNITISNMFVDKITSSKLINIEEASNDNFAHYYYVSRYFTVLPSVFSLISLNDYIENDKINELGIKVIDQYGNDYVDENTGKPKYKILLEPFKTDYNVGDTEVPYKILVFLTSPRPSGFKLIYNKFEVDEKGKRHNHQLRYTENLNAVPLFKEVPEESFVIDPNYFGEKNFSIKKLDNKFLNTSIPSTILQNGYQVITPSKAIKDYRNYEVFNWRIIGRVNRSLNLKEVNFGANRTVNACILYSQNTKNANAYALYRLQASPFNLSDFDFVNPLADDIAENNAAHWLVDIDSVSISDLQNYDIILWSPDSSITPLQAQKINDYITNKFGTLVLDMSNCPDAQRLFCGTQLSMSQSATGETSSLSSSNYLIDSNKNGGWDINDNIFEKSHYGVFGSRLTSSLTAKSYKYFSNTVDNNVFVKVGSSTSSQKPIGVSIAYSPAVDSLSKGNVIATTFPLMEYCNKVYSLSGSEVAIDDNIGETHAGNIEEENILPSIVEGPFKLLYNTVSYALYCKARAELISSTISSLTNLVTDWYSSWVIYGDALLDSEKSEFEFVPISSSESVYAKMLTKTSSSNDVSIFNFFKEKMSKKLPSGQISLLSEINVNDIEFFIEVTNPDVSIKDATRIENLGGLDFNIPSSYFLHRISQPVSNSFSEEPNTANSPLYAYTSKYSRPLVALSGMGPHVLVERPINSSSSRQLLSSINPSSGFHSYSFRLKSSYVSYEGIDKPTILQTKLNGQAQYDLMGTIKRSRTETVAGEPGIQTLKISSSGSAIDDFNLMRSKTTAETSNVFPYTGDIDIHNDPRIWAQGATGFSNPSSSTVSTFSATSSTTTVPDPNLFKLHKSWSTFREDNFGYLSNKVVYLYTNGEIDIVERTAKRPRNFETETYAQYKSKMVNSKVGSSAQFPVTRTSGSDVDEGIKAYGKSGSLTFTALYGYIRTSSGILEPALESGQATPSVEKDKYDNFVQIKKLNTPTISPVTAPSGNVTPSPTTSTGTKSSSSSSHEYIKYIQYTIAAAGHYSSAIDGVYGSATATGVRSFQQANNQRFIDSKVDSETKWYLAKYWLNLKSSNPELFKGYKDFASDDIKKYIQKVENMGLAQTIGNGKVYRKTTFTGFAGPNSATDILFIEIPSQMITVDKIIIVPDTDIRWRNYKVTSFGWASSFSTNIFEYPNIEPLDLSAVSSNIEIPMNGKPGSEARFAWINILGGGIYGLGQGEGFGISDIRIQGLVQGAPVDKIVEYDDPIRVTVRANFITSFKDVTPSSPSLIDLSNINKVAQQQVQYISSLTYYPDGANARQISFNDQSGLNLNSINYISGDGYEIKISNFLTNIVSNTYSLNNLSTSDTVSLGQEVSGSPISIRTTPENNVVLETASTYYGDSVTRTAEIDLSSGYRLKNRSGQFFVEGKNSINYGDGIVLLCNSNGKPIGLPTLADINASISNPSTLSEEERDIAYGYFTVTNDLPSDGLRYGFFDLNTQEFLGTSLSYIDLYSRSSSTNFENIFIAVCALDADGQSGDNEFVGLNSSTTFVPVKIPLKYLTPVYSVNYGGRSSISITPISSDLEKFDAWELPISNGSFNKKIKINSDIQWTDWKLKYSGQELLAQYSTMDLPQISWSKAYGYGHYDVANEQPVIVDSRSIKVRRTPILSWNHKTDYQQSLGGIVRQEFSIYIRETTGSVWTEVDRSLVQDVNCDTGVIKLKKRIIPSDPNLIKVSYSTLNKSSLIRQVSGKPIPINPFLNKDTIVFDKPMYIYLTPKNIYKKNAPGAEQFDVITYEAIDDFNYDNLVNFTYDSTLFDQSSVNYDPFAACIAVIYVSNNPNKVKTNILDLRLRGGGIKAHIENSDIVNNVPDIISHWDTYPSQASSYVNGGYVIIRIPEEVKQNFTSSSEIYNIIRNNLTAGVVFDLQNMEGKDWS